MVGAAILGATVLLGGWAAVRSTSLPQVRTEPDGGIVDLGTVDLARSVAVLPTGWDYWPGELFAPDDFAAGRVGAPSRFTAEDESAQTTGTYRLRLRLPDDGAVYALSGWSIDYATRIFVDGEDVYEAGVVTSTEAGFVPRIEHYTAAFQPKQVTVDVVVQYANFVHPEGGALREVELGTLAAVERQGEAERLPVWLLSGAMLMLALFYSIRFIVLKRLDNLLFAACCVLLALRSQYVWMLLLPPDYDWFVAYRINYACLAATCLAFAALVRVTYPLSGVRLGFRLVLTVQAAAYLVVAVGGIDVVISLTRPTAWFYGMISIAMAALFVAVLRRPSANDRIAAVGGLAFVSAQLVETVTVQIVPAVTRNGIAAVGMMVFAVCYMTVLNLNAEQIAVQLDRDRERLDLFRQMSHDLRTPLTRVSTNIQVASLTGGGDDGRLRESQDEIMRMAAMLDAAVDGSERE
ncbi:MAG: hypothetical protein LBE08_08985 [Bifidobacteriaceae bacterium]|nr:hypothetical protein [Bifidobacteriaceae bacterium]